MYARARVGYHIINVSIANVCLLSHAEKKLGRSVGFIFFFNIFFILKFSEFGSQELLFVIFLCLLTILNTFATVIDEIIPFGSRKRQNF